MQERKRVLLLIESSRAYGRGCLLGVAAYLRSHGRWDVTHVPRGLTERLPSLLKSWQGDGIIARIDNKKTAMAVAKLGVPTVDLRGSYKPANGLMIDTDAEIVSHMIAEHFLDIGFHNFACIGYPGVDFSEQRVTAYEEYLQSRGYHAEVYLPNRQLRHGADVLDWEVCGELEKDNIAGWLQTLPRPLAVFACNDIRGRQIIDACSHIGLSVPEEVAVIGVDDDEVICKLSNPTLSSVKPDVVRIGYEGAALLNAMIDGESIPSKTILVPPTGISHRRSSEVTAVDDSEVAAAMQLIRDHACEGLTVQQVIARLHISRSTLERRFLASVSRTPAAEIERVRMSQAKLLLRETRYKLVKIATLTGYSSASQFATAFKRYMQITPGEFRKSYLNTP